MESINTEAASATRPAAGYKKLFDFVRQNRLDPVSVLESRRKDIEVLATLNGTLLSGLQSLVRQQGEYLDAAAADLQSLVRGDKDAQGKAKVTEVLPHSIQKAVNGLRGLTDTVYKAQADGFAAVGRRMAENVEEVKGILRPRQ